MTQLVQSLTTLTHSKEKEELLSGCYHGAKRSSSGYVRDDDKDISSKELFESVPTPEQIQQWKLLLSPTPVRHERKTGDGVMKYLHLIRQQQEANYNRLLPQEVAGQIEIYVPLQAALDPNKTQDEKARFDLSPILSELHRADGLPLRGQLLGDMADTTASQAMDRAVQIILLQGPAGSGKSLTAWHVWREYVTTEAKSGRIPLFISLPEFKTAALRSRGEPGQGLMECYFDKYFHFDDNVSSVIKLLQRAAPFLIILDGFDELGDKNNVVEEQLRDWQSSVFVITSRSGWLTGGDVGTYIAPRSGMLSHLSMSVVFR
ncbi:MAG: NACHT domain-containing protein [Alcanivoracaceae bacterium]|nr:NACHT domain-containing protein [Alcanivoracaceae bacterium]